MAKKRLNRVGLHRKICTTIGVTSHSGVGYLSRKEMLELMAYLDRVRETFRQLNRLSYPDVIHIITEGNVTNESAHRD